MIADEQQVAEGLVAGRRPLRADNFERWIGHGAAIFTGSGHAGKAALAALMLATVPLGLSVAPAHAALTICNHTKRPAKLALGRFDGTQWLSEGWWTVAKDGCQTVVKGPLKARYYYLYATDGGPGSWDGSRAFCVQSSDKFRIEGRADCAGRGFDKKGFFEVDTGQKTDYTQLLSD